MFLATNAAQYFVSGTVDGRSNHSGSRNSGHFVSARTNTLAQQQQQHLYGPKHPPMNDINQEPNNPPLYRAVPARPQTAPIGLQEEYPSSISSSAQPSPRPSSRLSPRIPKIHARGVAGGFRGRPATSLGTARTRPPATTTTTTKTMLSPREILLGQFQKKIQQVNERTPVRQRRAASARRATTRFHSVATSRPRLRNQNRTNTPVAVGPWKSRRTKATKSRTMALAAHRCDVAPRRPTEYSLSPRRPHTAASGTTGTVWSSGVLGGGADYKIHR